MQKNKSLINRLNIAVYIPYIFCVRDILYTNVWEEMKKRKDVDFKLLCSNRHIANLVKNKEASNIKIITLPISRTKNKLFNSVTISKLFLWIINKLIYNVLIYRFTAINNLPQYNIRIKKSKKEQRRYRVFYEYSNGEWAGFPYPKSIALFKFFYDFYHGWINNFRRIEEDKLKKLNLDLFVFGRLHFHFTAFWATKLKKLGVPSIGIISSWDHPTTKGPTPRGMSGYIVASKRMAEEMHYLHRINVDKIKQIGKLQMDIFADKSIITPKEDFLDQIGIPKDHCLVTFGTNTTGLKEHEVSIARKLAKDFIAGRYGKATLLLRTHPQDINWEKDFLFLEKVPWVKCINAHSFGTRINDIGKDGLSDQILLANLMKHSNIVIQSRGSLALDAIAFNTPVISLAFDGDLIRSPNDSFVKEYYYEHYKHIVLANGTWMVGSYKVLDKAIREYLKNPELHAVGRKKIREEHLEPLDGKSAVRFVDYLVECALKARNGLLSAGDWELDGLGNKNWVLNQQIKIEDYIDN